LINITFPFSDSQNFQSYIHSTKFLSQLSKTFLFSSSFSIGESYQSNLSNNFESSSQIDQSNFLDSDILTTASIHSLTSITLNYENPDQKNINKFNPAILIFVLLILIILFIIFCFIQRKRDKDNKDVLNDLEFNPQTRRELPGDEDFAIFLNFSIQQQLDDDLYY
jgi:low temperature requirement protein LtrA